jgi:hypothetical protein
MLAIHESMHKAKRKKEEKMNGEDGGQLSRRYKMDGSGCIII